jgi:hypothetical protein
MIDSEIVGVTLDDWVSCPECDSEDVFVYRARDRLVFSCKNRDCMSHVGIGFDHPGDS